MPIIIGEKCPYCQKFRSPRDILHQPGGVVICQECEQKHLEALKLLSGGQFRAECAECGVNFRDLSDDDLVQTAVHFENGKYKVMCVRCSAIYTPKRRELYANTKFGVDAGLS